MYSGRFSIQLDKHNKDGIVHYMFEGVIGQNFLIIKEIFLTSAKSVNSDEMQHFVALYVGLQYLQKYSFCEFKMQWVNFCLQTYVCHGNKSCHDTNLLSILKENKVI